MDLPETRSVDLLPGDFHDQSTHPLMRGIVLQ
jgi:hypothetical protein